MTLFWCLTAIAVALGIARYNQSNKLFWILTISFLIGIAGASVYHKMVVNNDDQDKVELTQVCPTQSLQNIIVPVDFYPVPISTTTVRLEPVSASQVNTPEHSEHNFILSEWVIPTRTPPPQIQQV